MCSAKAELFVIVCYNKKNMKNTKRNNCQTKFTTEQVKQNISDEENTIWKMYVCWIDFCSNVLPLPVGNCWFNRFETLKLRRVSIRFWLELGSLLRNRTAFTGSILPWCFLDQISTWAEKQTRIMYCKQLATMYNVLQPVYSI